MSKPTKQQLDYRLPAHCCANCDFSEFNTYDDTICIKLDAIDMIIDKGGVCKLHCKEGVYTFGETHVNEYN